MPVQRFRRTAVTRTFMVGAAVWGTVVIVWLYAGIVARPDTSTTAAVGVGAGVLACVLFCLTLGALALESLVVDDTGVTIVGPLRRRRWQWQQVDAVDADFDTSITISPYLTLTDGRRVWLRCANGYAAGRVPPHVHEAVEEMRLRLATCRSSR